MKTLLRKSILTASMFLLAAATSPLSAQEEKLVYHKEHNPSIGIKVENAVGARYEVRDDRGNIVLQGTIKNAKTFYISTAKLVKGSFTFYIGSYKIQDFTVR